MKFPYNLPVEEASGRLERQEKKLRESHAVVCAVVRQDVCVCVWVGVDGHNKVAVCILPSITCRTAVLLQRSEDNV